MIENWPQYFYTIRTKSGKEREAAFNLENQGATVFAPFTKNQRREIRPAFPRYIFAAFELDRMFTKVRSTRGVTGIVRFGDEFVQIDSDILQSLLLDPEKEFVDFTESSPRFKYAVGQILLVTLGNWYGNKVVVADCYENNAGVNEYLLDPQIHQSKASFNGLRIDPSSLRFSMHEKGLMVA